MMATRLSILLLLGALFFSSLSHAGESEETQMFLDKGKAAAKEKRYCDASFYFSWAYEKSNDPKHIYNAAEVAFAADDRTRALDLYVTLRTKHPSFTKMGTVQSRIRTLGSLFTDSGSGIRCEQPDRNSVDDKKAAKEKAAKEKAAKEKAAKEKAAKEKAAKEKAAKEKAAKEKAAAMKAKNKDKAAKDKAAKEKAAKEKADAMKAKERAAKDKTLVDDALKTSSGCGNGVIDELETCDDGNRLDGDGCSSLCVIEESGGGFPLAGVLTASTGVVLAAVGGFGTYSISSTLNRLQDLEEQAEDARAERNFEELRDIENEAARVQESRFRPVTNEDDEDVIWGWGSVLTFGVGVSMIVGGTLWALLAESGE